MERLESLDARLPLQRDIALRRRGAGHQRVQLRCSCDIHGDDSAGCR